MRPHLANECFKYIHFGTSLKMFIAVVEQTTVVIFMPLLVYLSVQYILGKSTILEHPDSDFCKVLFELTRMALLGFEPQM